MRTEGIFSTQLFSVFFLYLDFSSLITMCTSLDFFGFILFGVHLVYWTYRFMPHPKFGNFLAFNISGVFQPQFCYTFWCSSDIKVGFVLLFHRSMEHCLYFFIISFLCCSGGWFLSSYLVCLDCLTAHNEWLKQKKHVVSHIWEARILEMKVLIGLVPFEDCEFF